MFKAVLNQIAEQLERPAGRVRLGVSPMAAAMVLVPRLGAFAQAYPDIALDAGGPLLPTDSGLRRPAFLVGSAPRIAKRDRCPATKYGGPYDPPWYLVTYVPTKGASEQAYTSPDVAGV